MLEALNRHQKLQKTRNFVLTLAFVADTPFSIAQGFRDEVQLQAIAGTHCA